MHDFSDDYAMNMYMAEAAQGAKLGRKTLSNQRLTTDRDALVWVLSPIWSDIGWQLTHAGTVEELRQAFKPLKAHPRQDLLEIFLNENAAFATSEEVRKSKNKLAKSIAARSRANEEYNRRATSFSEVKIAARMVRETSGVTPQQRYTLAEEYRSRKSAFKNAKQKDQECQHKERELQKHLTDKQAGFAQAELLDFVTGKRYARHPLGFANAMAGMPHMKWRQSHARCSKLKCETWPTFDYRVFQTIEKIWGLRDSYPAIGIVELFQREIVDLPKTIETEVIDWPHSAMKKVRIPDHMRATFADDFMYLRMAIEEALESQPLPQQVPFLIASRFLANRGKGRTALDLVLAAKERIV